MRDPLIIPYNDQFLVIASDNSGGFGLKEQDVVKVPYDIVAYYSFRVAVMECIAVGAVPVSVIMQNFCGDEAWAELKQGIQRGLEELGQELPISGSTESNMELLQSALGLNVVGVSSNAPLLGEVIPNAMKLAVIGKPLVGNEVMEQSEWVAPLPVFKWLCEQEEITVLPVGSKGIANEIKQLVPEMKNEDIHSDLDLNKSSGPSTCLIIAYPPEMETMIQEKTGTLFHRVSWSNR